jgi:hypothetical protein
MTFFIPATTWFMGKVKSYTEGGSISNISGKFGKKILSEIRNRYRFYVLPCFPYRPQTGKILTSLDNCSTL